MTGNPPTVPRRVRSSHLNAVLCALRLFQEQIDGAFCPALHVEVSAALVHIAEAADFDGVVAEDGSGEGSSDGVA